MQKKKIIKPFNTALVTSRDLQLMQNQDIVNEAARILRDEIKAINKKKLPDTITTNDLIEGECPEIPKLLNDFYVTLLSSSNYRRKKNNICKRLSKSFSEDLIFSVSNGQIKPSKQITLGLAIKGLTNSKKVIQLLHRHAQVPSYTKLEELETEAALAVAKSAKYYPRIFCELQIYVHA